MKIGEENRDVQDNRLVENLCCPNCGSESIVKNRFNRLGKQSYKCKDCGHQFVQNPGWQPIELGQISLLERLFLERIPLAVIARVLDFSESWLQRFVNHYYAAMPRVITVTPKTSGQVKLVQMDELWSFVQNKELKQWVWLALDTEIAEIVGCFLGDHSTASCQGRESMPEMYRQNTRYSTDFWSAYEAILPEGLHKAGGKETAITCMIER
jgi:insertion element IS1 protein InsB